MGSNSPQPIHDPTLMGRRLVIGPNQQEILDVVRRSKPRAIPSDGYPFSDTRVAVERDAQGQIHYCKIVRARFTSPAEIVDLGGSSPHGRTIYELKADFVHYLSSLHLPFLVHDTATGGVHSQRIDFGRRIRRGLPTRPDTDWNRNEPHNGGTGYQAADWFDYRIARTEHGFHLYQVFWREAGEPAITEIHMATVMGDTLDDFEFEIYFYSAALDKPVLLLDRAPRGHTPGAVKNPIPVAPISPDL